jgi:hypothetical protein
MIARKIRHCSRGQPRRLHRLIRHLKEFEWDGIGRTAVTTGPYGPIPTIQKDRVIDPRQCAVLTRVALYSRAADRQRGAITAIRSGGVVKRLPQKTLTNNSIAASQVLSITVWISPRIALPASQYDRDLRRVADSLNAMPIGI